MDDFRDVFPIVAADAEALSEAMWASREHGMAFWDAPLWATAMKADCGLLVTEGPQDGRRLGGVRFLNPFADALPRELEAALEPIS